MIKGETYTVHIGNNLNILPTLADNSIHSIVTDPPYELGFMGKKWDSSGIAYNIEFWKECLRVLKPGGHLLSFGGTRTWHRVAVAIEDAGFEVRDSIAWMYGSGFPKSLNLKGEWEGWGTALKPAFEPIVVARKPLIGTVAANVLEHGTGGLNIDDSRIGTEDNLNGGRYSDGKDETDSVVYNPGVNKRSKNDFRQPSGRWPANVILDEYSAELLDEQSGISKSQGGAMAKSSIWESGKERTTNHFGDTGGASRFFYVAKASKRDRNEGLEELPEVKTAAMQGNLTDGQRLSGDGQPIATPSRQNFHPTVKPTALMRYLVKLVTPPSGTVLDPFTGSGSTGKAAILEGFEFVGIELTEDYIPIIEGRLKHAEKTVNQTEEGLF